MAHIYATFMKQVLYVSKRKRKSHVHHHGQADNLRAGFEIPKWGAFDHPARLRNRPARLKSVLSDKTLALVGLSEYAESYPYQLSGGMQQRAAIARALIHDPKLVLMDEPFGALDAMTRDRLNIELMRIWRESGKTILFVTHGIQEAVFLGSHVAVMTSRPAQLAEYIAVDLPERTSLSVRTTPEFGAYTRRIYQLLDFD